MANLFAILFILFHLIVFSVSFYVFIQIFFENEVSRDSSTQERAFRSRKKIKATNHAYIYHMDQDHVRQRNITVLSSECSYAFVFNQPSKS